MNDIDNKIRNEALLAELLNGKDLRIKELETTLEIWHELMREKNKEIAMSDEVNRGLANRNHDLKMMVDECDAEIVLRGEKHYQLQDKYFMAKETLKLIEHECEISRPPDNIIWDFVREALLKLKEMEGK